MAILAAVPALSVLISGGSTLFATPANTISSPDQGGDVGAYTSLVLQSNGNPYVSYYDATNGDLKFVKCGNPNCAGFGNVYIGDETGDVGQHTSIRLDVDGHNLISYFDATNGNLKVLHCEPDIPACYATNSPDTGGVVGEYTSMAVAPGDLPVISYYDSTNQDLKAIGCGHASCSSGSITSPDTTGDVGRYASLMLDASGRPVISYYDATNGDVKVLHCGNVSCTLGNSVTAPDTAGDVGQYTSLTLDSNGNPVASYYDVTNSDLKLLRCDDIDCAPGGNSVQTVDAAGAVGQYTSVAVDGDDHPVVSYYDMTGGNLKVLHCGDATCTSGNTMFSPDTDGDVGRFTSLALDSNGYPVVSYYDVTNGNVRVLHCASSSCGLVSNSIVVINSGQFVTDSTVVLDGSGNPAVAYSPTSLKLARCGNPDCTTGLTVTTVLGSAGVSRGGLAVDNADKPVMSYYGASGGVWVLHCGNSDCTSGNTNVFLDSTTGPSSLVLDSSGYPVVAYSNASNFLKLVHCSAADCSSNTMSTVGGGAFQALALDAMGRPMILYVSGAFDLFLIHCNDVNCSGGDEPTATVSPVGDPLGASMTLDVSGTPIIAYWDSASAELHLVHCNDANCAGANESNVLADGTASDGGHVSVALDSAGNPVVSYRADGALRILRCGNPDCTSAKTVASPDSVGWYTALVLDSGDRPVVSYSDNQATGHLKVLHCGDLRCGSFPVEDFDGDSCPNVKEMQTAAGTWTSGGWRDAKNPYDYFNPTKDGLNRVDDILAVVAHYFEDQYLPSPPNPPNTPNPNYTTQTDRTYVGPNPWSLGPPNGLQRVDDILAAVYQYFHDCP